eukprot:1990280-Pyramimonas_sp.AAC.1
MISRWLALPLTHTAFVVLHCTTLHYTALYYTALHCTSLYCTSRYCAALHYAISSVYVRDSKLRPKGVFL